MKIGVTGTRNGATTAQLIAVAEFIDAVGEPSELHHGDCLGVDEQVAGIAYKLGLKIVCHPPESDYLRAYFPSAEYREPAGYHQRDRAIVDETEVLIVVPLQNEWQTSGGTWYTCAYARKIKKPYVIFYPNGVTEVG